ncbi:alpha/beta hydrolase-fold protein [Luteimonas sp. FXH3W]|uniref:Alpha/beta hydrolase-fold protein n=1 Tax=Aquilutibacter rugosus TaxID=3115820 RepID=A0ABU7V0P5_9GAMM
MWISTILSALLAATPTAATPVTSTPLNAVQDRAPAIVGRLERYSDFPSEYVSARNVQVWLPPSYDADRTQRYPVLYMHDGQMLWDATTTWNHQSWDVDDVMTRLIQSGEIREAIVVGIDNSPQRFAEYMPRKAIAGPVRGLPDQPLMKPVDIQSDAYLQFLVRELKPFVDGHYRTRRGAADTMIAGSSMGGLISLYAMTQYPKVFGGVAAISTHWPAGEGAMVNYLARHLPSPRDHRVYFDHGTATLDAQYAPYQQRTDAVMRNRGYRCGENWLSKTFDGADHSETAWNQRLDVPLRFLLGKQLTRC